MSSKQAIIDLETRFWQTLVDKDAETAVAMLADRCIVAGAQGAMPITAKDYAGMLKHGTWTLHGFELSDVVVTFPVPGTAVIAYKIVEDMTVDEKPLTLKAADCSVWVHKDDAWSCALHTESLLGDPYGRDRSTK